MALHYDIRGCNPPTFQDQNDSVNHYVLFTILMVVGIGEITEKNFEEIYNRVHAIEKESGGGFRLATDKETQASISLEFSREEIKRFIGLKTNIAFTPNRVFWRKHKRAL